MPVRPNFNPDFLYFVTTTAEKHVHIFERESIVRIILDSLHFLRTSGRMKLCGFVVMPNHIHLIGRFDRDYTLSDMMRDFKRHTARQIVRQFMAERLEDHLETLRSLNTHDGQEYKIWEDGYDARDVFSPWFLMQKMDYIHYNPCQPHWKLASTPEEYPWSSAQFYILDKPCVIPVDDARDML